MRAIRRIAALACAAATLVAFAAAASAQTGDASKARFSDATSYGGKPDLPLTAAMIAAGGGPATFDAAKLVHTLAGSRTDGEVKKLTANYGAENVKSFLAVFDFVVADALAPTATNAIVLPTTPEPDPKDGKALAAALYKAGLGPDGRYDVEYLLDTLLTHGIHVRIMDDVDAKFGRTADANYHIVFMQAMNDLRDAYKR
jgi:hypothetical protein